MTDTVRVPRELVQFLLGEAEMDGLWFGDAPRYVKGDARYGQFWWRHDLRAMLAASPQGEGSSADALPGDLREKVTQIIEAAIERHNPGKSLRHTVDDADAILSLIQSERGEP